MAKTIYMFGAGINRGVTDWHGLVPPLATDFFQQVLKSDKYNSEHYLVQISNLTDYIKRYWKLSVDELRFVPFDLESCYTMIQLQSLEASSKGENEKVIDLAKIEYQLTAILAEFLSEFEHFTFRSDSFSALGQIIYSEKASVITFNYDTLLEASIGSASGVNPNAPKEFRGFPPDNGEVSDAELAYSHLKWNRPLAYGVKFDEVQLQRAGISTFATSDRFYGHPDNKMYSHQVLKLHGSLNWFVYTGISIFPRIYNQGTTSEKKGKSILYRGNWWFARPPELNGDIIVPIIVTPALHKEIYINPIIQTIWEKAQEELENCERLIIGGYSFPPTDFNTKRLFLESFETHRPKEIVVINPDTSVIKTVKELCHFNKPVLSCKDLDEFIKLYQR